MPDTPKTDSRPPQLRARGVSDPGVDEPVSTPKPIEGHRLHSDPGLKVAEGGSIKPGHSVRISGNDEDAETRTVSADSRPTTRCKSPIATHLEPRNLP